jgi:D-alanyl-D-alanine dipeptidase
MKRILLLCSFALPLFAPTFAPIFAQDLVEIRSVDPTIVVEARYAGVHNFIGRPIIGYHAEKCFLTPEAASALAKVQAEVRTFGLSLKVYDCYRPQRAVNDFIAWAKDEADQKMKREFYPRVDKRDAFKLGYISEKSGHSRGSTVDLTLVPLPAPPQPQYRDGQRLVDCTARRRWRDNTLDMGTGYDCFDELAHAANPNLSPLARRNRLLLKSVMEKFGFRGIVTEWWHFTLANEPFPNTYFDAEVK